VEYHRKSDGAAKKKILGCTFSEKLVLKIGRDETIPFTLPIQVILNASEIKEERRAQGTGLRVE